MKTKRTATLVAIALALAGCATHHDGVTVNSPLLTAKADDTETANGSTDRNVTFDLDRKYEDCVARYNRAENGPVVEDRCHQLQLQAMEQAQSLIDRSRLPIRGNKLHGPGTYAQTPSPYNGVIGGALGGFGPSWGGWAGGGMIAPPIQQGGTWYTGADPRQGYSTGPTPIWGHAPRPSSDATRATDEQIRASARTNRELRRRLEELERERKKHPAGPSTVPKPPAPAPSQPVQSPSDDSESGQ